MRKALLMAGVLLALSATVASAAGVDLAWGNCRGKTGALTARTSTCVSNSGSQSMFASFNSPSGITALEGCEIFIDYHESDGPLSCWWNFATGALRSAALTALFLPPTDVNGDALTLCGTCTAAPCLIDDNGYYFAAHGASGGGGGVVTGPDTGQLKGIVAIQAGTGTTVPADVQQYACGFRITNVNTVGGSCPGCLEGVTLTLSQINLTQPGIPNITLTTPAIGNMITWNGGFTKIENKSWGAVKALYRN